jgi:hypothetical protein
LKPIADPTLLDTGDATAANNVRLVSGALQPMKGLTTLKATSSFLPQTIYRYGDSATESEYWFEFATDVDVMRSPIADDPYGRAYWTDGVKPKYGPNSLLISGSSYPGASYDLGIPKPASAPTLAGTAPGAAAQGVTLTVVYTYVSAYGEEGPPSDASPVLTADIASAITVGQMSTAPAGAYNISAKRIYIASTVGNSAEFQFWKEIPVATTSTSGLYEQAALGEVLPTEGWNAPPAGLKGLKLMASGAAVGFVGNTAYFSEPNLPHAWPHVYPTDFPIVGIGVFRQTVVLLTTSFPVLLTGIDPAAMSAEKLELQQACLSKNSIVDTGDGVLYASPDGLVSIGSGGIDVVTSKVMTRDQWQSYNPASMKAYSHDGRYHAFFQRTDGSRGVLIIDFSGQGALLTECNINSTAAVTAGYTDARTDTLYLARANNIERFNAGSALTYVWRSKVFRLPAEANFGFAAVNATAYPLTLRVYAGGVLRHTQSVQNDQAFRLPAGFLALDWQLELEGTSQVTRVRVANSIQELQA